MIENYEQAVKTLTKVDKVWLYGIVTGTFIPISKKAAKTYLTSIHEFESDFGQKRVFLDDDNHLRIEV